MEETFLNFFYITIKRKLLKVKDMKLQFLSVVSSQRCKQSSLSNFCFSILRIYLKISVNFIFYPSADKSVHKNPYFLSLPGFPSHSSHFTFTFLFKGKSRDKLTKRLLWPIKFSETWHFKVSHDFDITKDFWNET